MTNRDNPFGDQYVCESCLAIIGPEQTESYRERHGPLMIETLSRTTCCRAGYSDLCPELVIDELQRIQALTHFVPNSTHYTNTLDQLTRDNIDAIIPILETVWEM